MGDGNGIDVDIDDAAVRVARLHQLVDIAGCGDPGADVEELVDALIE
jgi:hypothetical protein